ncbi:hypothetical protein M422DRAFT_24417 [Sphaerobolus stellatus SS14]|nr:hypothetical protein M422DRAFT_24417 [Sphaerobolus stellatus SS14]
MGRVHAVGKVGGEKEGGGEKGEGVVEEKGSGESTASLLEQLRSLPARESKPPSSASAKEKANSEKAREKEEKAREKEEKAREKAAAAERDSLEASRQQHAEALAQNRHFAHPHSPINRIASNPQLFDPVRAPRNPIVLCHGLYGFDVRGPEVFPKLRMHYWSNVLHILRKKVGAEVIVTGVPGTGSIASRAERMDRFLKENVKGRDINFLAHSMGGLDCRHLITHIEPSEYRPISLTSLSVPHRGSPFMDWCLTNIGIGSPRPFPFPNHKNLNSHQYPHNASSHVTMHTQSAHGHRQPNYRLPYSLSSPLLSRRPSTAEEKAGFALSMLPSSFTSLVLSLLDSPAYSNLTTTFLRDVFNPSTPDKPDIKYFSLAARTTKMSIWHPLWLPKLIIDAAEEQEAILAAQGDSGSQGRSSSDMTVSYPDVDLGRERDPSRGNDGLVTISSAKWGNFLGIIEGCDHWEVRGARGLGADWDEGWGKVWREWTGRLRESGSDKAESVWNLLGMKAKEEKAQREEVRPSSWASQNGLGTRFDLERFYVAISRKLYDEGL